MPDGRLSSYPRAQEFGFWDIWGRKYALLGLVAYYDQTGDKNALKAACRSTDALIEISGPGKTKAHGNRAPDIGFAFFCVST